MLSLLSRFKELLVVGALLLYPFVSLLVNGHQPRRSNFLDSTLIGITSHVQRALDWMLSGVGGTWTGYVALHGVGVDNEKLRAENARLRSEENRYRELSLENERLRQLLTYATEREGKEISARVIGVNPVLTTLSVRINRGEDDGIQVSMPVLTPDGIVGQVVRTTGGYADVALVTDPASKIGVRIQRSRARATAIGAGGGRNLKLANALRTEDIQEGDVVVTSGTDGLFPAGLVVGKVQGVSRREHGMFVAAEIVPAVDTDKLEELLVIPPTPATTTARTASEVPSPGGSP